MDQYNHTFKDQLDEIRLTPQEKAAMRLRLYEAMHAAPAAPAARPVPSPYAAFFAMHRFMGAIAALLIIVLIGGTGTAYAAEGALPGDLLYLIKIGVNEQVQTALASTPAQKAQVHVELAQRRLEEAQALAVAGKLNASTTAEITSNFDAHAAAAQDLSKQLAKADPSTAAQISVELTSTLNANDAVLASIAGDAKDSQTRQSSEDLSQHVRAIAMADTQSDSSGGNNATTFAASARPAAPAPKGKGFAVATLRVSTTAPENPATTSTQEGASSSEGSSDTAMQDMAAKFEDRATAELTAARAQYAAMKSSLDASTTVQFDARFASADILMHNGSAALGAGEYDSAVANFKSAFGAAVSLTSYLHAGKNLPSAILNRLIGGGDRGTSSSSDSLHGGDSIETSSASSSGSGSSPEGSSTTATSSESSSGKGGSGDSGKGDSDSQNSQGIHVQVSVPPIPPVHIEAPEIHL